MGDVLKLSTNTNQRIEDCFEYQETEPIEAYVTGSLDEPENGQKYTMFDKTWIAQKMIIKAGATCQFETKEDTRVDFD